MRGDGHCEALPWVMLVVMRRPQATPESRARAERIARSLAGLLDDVPAPTLADDDEPGASPGAAAGGRRSVPPRPAGARAGGELVCPRCVGAMATVGMNHGVEIDQCLECGAIWLDAGELDQLVAGQAPVDAAPPTMGELRTRMRDVLPGEAAVKYRECPRCREVMRRTNFGTISGVVVDECMQHGVLLDPGELQAIEAFVKLGGQALGEQTRLEQGIRSLPPPPPPDTIATGLVRRDTAGPTLFDLLFRW
jgi:Zn-finger nucleic acid-binding protein